MGPPPPHVHPSLWALRQDGVRRGAAGTVREAVARATTGASYRERMSSGAGPTGDGDLDDVLQSRPAVPDPAAHPEPGGRADRLLPRLRLLLVRGTEAAGRHRPVVVALLLAALLAGVATVTRLAPPPPSRTESLVTARRSPTAPPAPLRLGRPPAGLVPPVLIAADKPYRVDPVTGVLTALDLPARWSRRLVLTVTPIADSVVVQVSPPAGEPSGRNLETLRRSGTGEVTAVGFGRTVLAAASGDGFWLVGDSAGRTVVRRFGPDGTLRATWPVPPTYLVAADTGRGLLLQPVGPGAGAIIIADPATGWTVRQEVAGDGIVYGYAAGRVLWSGWGEGPLRVTELVGGSTWPLRSWPADLRRAGSVAIAPDGRTYAAPASFDADRASAVVVGGLDDGSRVDVLPLGPTLPPVLTFASAALLVGHDGTRLLAVLVTSGQAWAVPSAATRIRDIVPLRGVSPTVALG